MKSKVEILGDVMMSFKSDQTKIMNDINALLGNRDRETGLVDKLKYKITELSSIHASMSETQAFILQMTSSDVEKKAEDKSNDEDTEK